VVAGDLRLFERFKMLLLNGTPTEATMAIDSAGRPFPLIKVVAELLRFVKADALRELSNAVPQPVTADQARCALVHAAFSVSLRRLAAASADKFARAPAPDPPAGAVGRHRSGHLVGRG
jgi:hypothetical protein